MTPIEDGWDGVTVEGVDDDNDANTPDIMRVTEVDLFDSGLTGSLSAEWAKADCVGHWTSRVTT